MIKISYCHITLTLIRKVAVTPPFVNITTEDNCARRPHPEAGIAPATLTAVSQVEHTGQCSLNVY